MLPSWRWLLAFCSTPSPAGRPVPATSLPKDGETLDSSEQWVSRVQVSLPWHWPAFERRFFKPR